VLHQPSGHTGVSPGLHHQGKALENGIQPLQQAVCIAVTQGQLPLAPGEFEVHVHRRRRFRQ
jgi:hypothetical protein